MSDVTTSSQRASAPGLIGIRQADHRIGGDHPHGLDLALFDGLEQVHRLQAGLVGHGWRVPEVLHDVAMARVGQFHVRGQHIGQSADFASAHGVGLARERERPMPGGRCGRSAGGS
jgi:hypothetical protein